MEFKDPVKVSPENYKLLQQEGDFRLVEMILPAGKSDVEHSHHHEMVYFISGGKVRIHLPDADPVDLEIPDGHSMTHDPWTHRVENIGTTDIRAVIFERK